MQSQRPETSLKPVAGKLYFIDCPLGDAFGPFSDPALADTVMRIVHMTIDETATLEEVELNPWKKELTAGLKPFLVSIESRDGIVTGNKIELSWPPYDCNCKVEERMGFVSYFVWAKTQGEAVRCIPPLASQAPVKPDFDIDESNFPQEPEESEA